MKRIFFWATIASGLTAAYLMYRRGESFRTIARKSLDNPFGSLASELKISFTQPQLPATTR